MPSLRNIVKAYNASCTNQPRDSEFRKSLNLAIWETKVVLKRLLLEKPIDLHTPQESEILTQLMSESITDQLGTNL